MTEVLNDQVKSETTKGQGAATILAIGTANPSTITEQSTFPDFLFRATKREDKIELKEKFQRICDGLGIEKRYTHISQELFDAHPNLYTNGASSYDTRQSLLLPDVAKLGKEAALKAIEEWGQPVSKITHLVCSIATDIEMPSMDYHLANLLNLNTDVQRYMYYQQGCYSGAAAVRSAKDLAENNPGARVLVVSAELLTTMFFHGPMETKIDHLVGTHPDPITECPLFQMESAKQRFIPDSGDEAFAHISITDWNSLFYVVHPGGPAILKKITATLGLKDEKLRESFQILKDYGNMGGPSVIFALDNMRKRAIQEGKETTGDGLQWGVLVGLGPGITMETIVLRSCPIQTSN
ncbi:hypothetical protein ACFE04_004122 [Oxalis oulophora]